MFDVLGTIARKLMRELHLLARFFLELSSFNAGLDILELLHHDKVSMRNLSELINPSLHVHLELWWLEMKL